MQSTRSKHYKTAMQERLGKAAGEVVFRKKLTSKSEHLSRPVASTPAIVEKST
jgi:hypothetical protein